MHLHPEEAWVQTGMRLAFGQRIPRMHSASEASRNLGKDQETSGFGMNWDALGNAFVRP